MIRDNRGDIRGFTRDSLPQVERLLSDSRAAIAQVRELAHSLHENPSQLLFEKPDPGVDHSAMSHLRLSLVCLSLLLCGCSGLFHSSVAAAAAVRAAAAAARASVGRRGLRSARTGDPRADPAHRPAAAGTRARHRPHRPDASGQPTRLLRQRALERAAQEVVSDLTLAAFRDDPAWSAVADERGTLNAEYLLQISIDRFSADYATESAPPTVRVDLHGLLIRRADGLLAGSFAVSENEQAPANRMASVVTVFSAVADRAVLAVAAHADQLLRSAKSPAAP